MTQAPTPAAPPIWDAAAIVPRRSLLFCTIGALLGLLIAGYGLFTAQGTRIAGVAPDNAATVNTVPILRADLIQQVAALYAVPYGAATPAQKRKVLDDMIREELKVQRGIEIGLPADDIDVRVALAGATDAQVAQDTLTQTPAEQELRGWYAAHADTYAADGYMTLHEWISPGPADVAAKGAAGLRQGIPAAALGLTRSSRVDDGEQFYFAARIHLGKALFDIARRMRAGDVAPPVRLPDGFHILQMVSNQPPVATDYATVRDQVLRDFQADRVARLQRSNDQFLSRRADIKIATDLQ